MQEPSAAYYKFLVSRDFLYGVPRDDVFHLLIDCYRMRKTDRDAFLKHKIVSNHTLPMEHFSKFLNMAEKHGGVLPPWWSETDRDACREEASKVNLGQEIQLEHEVIDGHAD
ncbi:hypothetical protein MMC28_002520 [Mycoblastus sanguinarius]|nr:hypothetical protein [Mycoblastus sanguinarius]